MKRSRSWAGKSILTILLVLTLAAYSEADEEYQPPGPMVGESVPVFGLVDQTGQEQTLKNIAGDQPIVAIVFHRSASW